MAEAGFADGFDIGFGCPSGAYSNFEQVCEAVAAQLGEVGVNASLEITESGAYWDLEAAETATAALSVIAGQTPTRNRTSAFSAPWAEKRPASRLGLTRWSTASSLTILATTDDAARAALYEDLQQHMYDEPPFIYLYVPFSFEASTDRVVNYKPRSAEEYWLWDLAAG